MTDLEKAIAIAVEAHQGQVDKSGEPYILHPLRLMFAVTTTEERIAAVLHDVIEDSQWTFADLREKGFSEAAIEAVDALTRRPAESYEDFILRAKANPIARRVKLADLKDNSDITRLKEITDNDRARLAKYQRALEVLQVPAG